MHDFGFGFFIHDQNSRYAILPLVFRVSSATLAAVPWIHARWRFSLRTLLIATTLVAVVLGLVVYAARK